MSRVLLVDDSPHAQRIGERILADEGFEVVTVSTGDAALIRLDDVDPDIVVADTVMPGRNGYDICHYLKLSPRHRHVRVILTAGVLDQLDEAELKRVGADGTLRKPFEATALVTAVKPLAEAVAAERALKGLPARATMPEVKTVRPKTFTPFVTILDAEQVHAAVTIALDAAMGNMVEEITRRVLETLTTKPSQAQPESVQPGEAPMEIPPKADAEPSTQPETPAPPLPAASVLDAIRRVSPMRVRSGSILGLDLTRVDLENKPAPPKSN